MSDLLARMLGHSPEVAMAVGMAGARHDIGKFYLCSISDIVAAGFEPGVLAAFRAGQSAFDDIFALQGWPSESWPRPNPAEGRWVARNIS